MNHIESTLALLRERRASIDSAIIALEQCQPLIDVALAAPPEIKSAPPAKPVKLKADTSKPLTPLAVKAQPAAEEKPRKAYTRKTKQPQTLGEAKVSVDTALSKPETLAAAMKQYARLAKAPVSAAEMEVHLNSNYPELIAGKSSTAIYANLSYWASHGKMNKTGEGYAATFSITDKDFFKNTGE